MAKLDIVYYGNSDDAILMQPAKRVRTFDAKLHQLLDDMLETMRDANGVGLAAPQIGVERRITVLEWPKDVEDAENTMQTFELINPEIVRVKGAAVGQEGCLSLPGIAADVERGTMVVVRAQDRHGKQFRLKAFDWLARIIQHEIDHLGGVLMTDKAEQLYRIVENDEGEYEAVPIEETVAA